jgi:hypothetical protein
MTKTQMTIARAQADARRPYADTIAAMQRITVQIRQVYGNETIYPACPRSAFFCALAGTKTITPDMLRLIRAQGYDVAVEAPTLRFT